MLVISHWYLCIPYYTPHPTHTNPFPSMWPFHQFPPQASKLGIDEKQCGKIPFPISCCFSLYSHSQTISFLKILLFEWSQFSPCCLRNSLSCGTFIFFMSPSIFDKMMIKITKRSQVQYYSSVWQMTNNLNVTWHGLNNICQLPNIHPEPQPHSYPPPHARWEGHAPHDVGDREISSGDYRSLTTVATTRSRHQSSGW